MIHTPRVTAVPSSPNTGRTSLPPGRGLPPAEVSPVERAASSLVTHGPGNPISKGPEMVSGERDASVPGRREGSTRGPGGLVYLCHTC